MIISNSAMYRNMQQQKHEEPKQEEHMEPKVEKKEHNMEHMEHMEHNMDVETTNVSSDSMMTIAKMVSSMLESSNQTYDIKCLYEKIHELDKRLAVNEALLKHLSK